MSGHGSSVRSRLAGDLESQYDKVVAALEDAMDSTKRAWAYCPDCSKKVQVDYPDHTARMKAVELWLEQGLGRAGAGGGRDAGVPSVSNMDELESLTPDQLAAYCWARTPPEQRARDLALVRELRETDFPSDFFDLLERVEAMVATEGES